MSMNKTVSALRKLTAWGTGEQLPRQSLCDVLGALAGPEPDLCSYVTKMPFPSLETHFHSSLPHSTTPSSVQFLNFVTMDTFLLVHPSPIIIIICLPPSLDCELF